MMKTKPKTELEVARRDAGLSRAALAKAARVPEGDIRKAERDPSAEISARTAVKISVALNISAKKLFAETEDPKR